MLSDENLRIFKHHPNQSLIAEPLPELFQVLDHEFPYGFGKTALSKSAIAQFNKKVPVYKVCKVL